MPATNTTFTTEQEVLNHLKEITDGLSSIVTINAIVDIDTNTASVLNECLIILYGYELDTETKFNQTIKNIYVNVTDWSV